MPSLGQHIEPWTQEESERLLNLSEANHTIREISSKLNRSAQSCRSQLRRLSYESPSSLCPYVFDLPPWFLEQYGRRVRRLRWRDGLRHTMQVLTATGHRELLLEARAISPGRYIVRPVEADRFWLFREELVRNPL